MGFFTSTRERAAALKGVSIFAGLPMDELIALQKHCDETSVEDGFELARQDRAPQQMIILVRGEAEVLRNDVSIATLGPGDTIGELSLLDGGQQTATVIARGPCDVLAVPIQDFGALIAEAPEFSRKLLASLAHRLRLTDELLVP